MRNKIFLTPLIWVFLALLMGPFLAFAKGKHVTQTVIIEGMKFNPDVTTVHTGDTIIWVNKDIVPHTATGLAGEFNSGEIKAEHKWKYRFSKPGTISYACSFHPTMKASVHVESE